MRVVLGAIALVMLIACDEGNQPPPANPSTPPTAGSMRETPPCVESASEQMCVCPGPPGKGNTSVCQAPANVPGFCFQNRKGDCVCGLAGCVAGSSTCVCAPAVRGEATCSTDGAHCCMDPRPQRPQCQCVYGMPGHVCPAGATEVPSCGVADVKLMYQMKGNKVVGACMPLVP